AQRVPMISTLIGGGEKGGEGYLSAPSAPLEAYIRPRGLACLPDGRLLVQTGRAADETGPIIAIYAPTTGLLGPTGWHATEVGSFVAEPDGSVVYVAGGGGLFRRPPEGAAQ